MKLANALVVLTFLYPTILAADTSSKSQIDIRGFKEATVTSPQVRLGDVASVNSASSRDDEAIIALRKIVVGNSPAPGTSQDLDARSVLGRLEKDGVLLTQLRYTLPQNIRIVRAGRTVSREELLNMAREEIKKGGSDISIKSISSTREMIVPSTANELVVKSYRTAIPGKMSFTLSARTPEGEEQSIPFEAVVDEWKLIPVAGRPIERGAIVEDRDIMMARLSISSLPKDVLMSNERVVGLKTTNDIRYGDLFRVPTLAVPPLVLKGGKVKLLYRDGFLEAMAIGEALETGVKDSEVKVRNENSKKIVRGIVRDLGVVEVTQ